jgi:hypothetical protein
MKSFKEIEDNRSRIEAKEMQKGLDHHNSARLAMMMAEERGEDLSYEDALKLMEVKDVRAQIGCTHPLYVCIERIN